MRIPVTIYRCALMLQRQTENKGRYTKLDEQRRARENQIIPRILAAFRDQHVAALSQLDLIGSLLLLPQQEENGSRRVEAISISELALTRLPRPTEVLPLPQLTAPAPEVTRPEPPHPRGRPPGEPGRPPLRMAIDIYVQEHGGNFTSPALIAELKARGYKRDNITQILQSLTNTGVLQRVGQVGRGFAYRVKGAAKTAESTQISSPTKTASKRKTTGSHWPVIEQYALRFGKPFGHADLRKELADKLPGHMLTNIGTYLHNYAKSGRLKKGRNTAGAAAYSLTAKAAKDARVVAAAPSPTAPVNKTTLKRITSGGQARIAAGGPRQVDSIVDWATRNNVEEFSAEQALKALKSLPKFRGYSARALTQRLNDFTLLGQLERPEKGRYRVAAGNGRTGSAEQDKADGGSRLT